MKRAVPVTGDLPDYGARKPRGDLIAALTVAALAALAVPSAMAYAELAGLSPVARPPRCPACTRCCCTRRK